MNHESPVHLQAPAPAPIQAPAPALARAAAPVPGLSVVIPVYRGAATIGHLVQSLSALAPEGGLEIILVNDGSPDNSAEVCIALVATPACRSPT